MQREHGEVRDRLQNEIRFVVERDGNSDRQHDHRRRERDTARRQRQVLLR